MSEQQLNKVQIRRSDSNSDPDGSSSKLSHSDGQGSQPMVRNKSGSSGSSECNSVGGEDLCVYDHIYKGIKGFLSRRTSLGGSYSSSSSSNKVGERELCGPLTYALSSNLRIESINSQLGSFPSSGGAMDFPLVKVTRRKRVKYTFHIDENVISWNNSKKEIFVDSIKDIRSGDLATNYMDMYDIRGPMRELWCTIIYSVSKNKLKALHVVADNKVVFQSFYDSVVYLINSRRRLMEEIALPNNEQFANIHWQTNVSTKKEDEEKDSLSFPDVKRLCNRYHIYCSDAYLRVLFERADTNHNGLLNFAEFQDFVRYLRFRPEVQIIHDEMKDADSGMVGFESFYRFLNNVQGEVMSRTYAYKIFRKFCTSPLDDSMDMNGLLEFLTKQPFLKFFEEDYSRPLNEYFISSSHNTYLMGKQLVDEVSVEAYTRALQQGCRCIEIDIWQGDHGPVVCHGLFTQSIPLEDVIKTIRKYAFITSPYPLIVSLEIHCKKDFQAMIFDIMKEILGDLIYVIPPNSQQLLSPMELKNRIILKSKKTQAFESDSAMSTTSGGATSSSPYDTLSESGDSIIESGRRAGSFGNTNLSPTVSRKSVNGASGGGGRSLRLSSKVEISEQILEISGIHGVRFRNFSLPESKTTTHCFSLNEKKFLALYKDEIQRLAINKHNRRHLMRVYPHVWRYKSTNFNPIQFWVEGVQMVATNWQTYDLGQQLNHAMFQVSLDRNSIWHSGYVLKPPHLRREVHKMKDIPAIVERVKRQKINVQVDVLSGQMLSLQHSKVIAPYVEIEIYTDNGVESLKLTNCIQDEGCNSSSTTTSTTGAGGCAGTGGTGDSSKEDGWTTGDTPLFATKYVRDNGFNPVWNASFQCTLTNTTFNFVRFTVKNGGQVVATSCIRLHYLKQGYRHLPLYNCKGEKFIFSTLFIRYRETDV